MPRLDMQFTGKILGSLLLLIFQFQASSLAASCDFKHYGCHQNPWGEEVWLWLAEVAPHGGDSGVARINCKIGVSQN